MVQRILLLSGPAGAGKTTTVRVVAKEMGVELMEWGEGADDSIVGAGVGELEQTDQSGIKLIDRTRIINRQTCFIPLQKLILPAQHPYRQATDLERINEYSPTLDPPHWPSKSLASSYEGSIPRCLVELLSIVLFRVMSNDYRSFRRWVWRESGRKLDGEG